MASQFMISYDIANPKRLKKVHKVLLGYGIPVQYSIFYVKLELSLLNTCIKTITETINLKEDDVRIYPIYEFDLSMWNKLNSQLVNNAILVE